MGGGGGGGHRCRFQGIWPRKCQFCIMVRYTLKYCLKGPLNPKQQTNQIQSWVVWEPSLYGIAATMFTLKFRIKMRLEVIWLHILRFWIQIHNAKLLYDICRTAFPLLVSQGKTGYTFSVSSPQRILFPFTFTRRSASLQFVNRPCSDHRNG